MRSELNQLREFLAAQAEQDAATLDLPGDLDTSRGFARLFAERSGLAALHVEVDDWKVTSSSVRVSGDGTAPSGAVGATLFEVGSRSDRAYFRLVFTPTAGTITGIFPLFPERLFDGFEIGKALLLLEIAASDDDSDPYVSLEAQVEYGVREAMPPLVALLGGKTKLKLRGPVELVDGRPQMTLAAGLIETNEMRLPYFDFPLPLDLALNVVAESVEPGAPDETENDSAGKATNSTSPSRRRGTPCRIPIRNRRSPWRRTLNLSPGCRFLGPTRSRSARPTVET